MQNNYESLELGQFIPLHYHYNMLNDPHRMKGFKQAIDWVVKPGAKVLELGGGTGVQSFCRAKAQRFIALNAIRSWWKLHEIN
ncbi:MAG: hypothetical protein H6940_05315 [Burkholderiales bacterium]|nr:hypothetical protein [Burkholderiales bacterium]